VYDASIRYVDDAVGRLLDSLGSELDNTIVVISADHGDEFGEHGKFSHFTLYDGLLRVPLIIAGPNIKPGTVINQQVSLIDLAPTLTALAGIEKVSGFAGENLLPLINGGAKKTEDTISTLAHPRGTMISYRIPGWKYIRTDNLDGSLLEEIYDLTDDQGETRNLHGMSTAEVKRFEAEATKKLAEFKQRKAKQFTDNEKVRIRAKLNKLGKL